ncbi:glutamate ABC transporter substrate-binding protein [Microlunatus capsulatus]|uniref:Polar amino acid transport system substrate-binding protein n=1 Tax=Microlunatus capsulatus TaxID=99117 RepID=A0ABS4Z3Z7_9ACTN|nr:glutamate ABC transporter substrate-binding protein [Microlunatus capsulatus]MBP2415766.1 polar amino acid transport system substrate-binding protein [Microlunatus capsulatus]
MSRVGRLRAGLAAGVLLALLPACGVLADDPTPLPAAPPSTAAPSAPPAAAPATCTDRLQSYAPDGPLPAPDDLPAGSTMAKIRERGRLVAGVSADTYLLGSRNPLNGRVEGFDIDLVKAVAKAIFGDEDRYQLRVITAADRIPLLESGDVDLVARNMTITCDRWTQIAFSSEYYRSGQKILVRRGSKATTLAQLGGSRVCAPRGTSSLSTLREKAPQAVAVESDSHTGCLVLFQQGQVDAITGDDTVLAGLAAQDPYAVVPRQDAFTEEPYGLGMNADDVDLVRFVNARLAQMRGNGEWEAIYDRWLAEPLGPAPAPPKAVYGRRP